MICDTPTKTLLDQYRRLRGKHHRQIESRSDAEIQQRSDLFALTFRPGDRTSTFHDKTLRPFGAAVGVVLSYASDGTAMTLGGFRGRVGLSGEVRYGCHADREFQYEVRRFVRDGSRNQLPIARNPSLAELTLRMDTAVARCNPARRPELPALPRIILGFPPDRLPTYEMTEGLRRYVAEKVEIPLEHLNGNPASIVEPLLRGTWEALVLEAGVDPNTGLVLVDAELCSGNCRPLRAFEDFSALVGDWTWNPVRELDLPRAPNPAFEILQKYGVDPGEGFEQPIPDERLKAMVAEFRETVELQASPLDEEDVLDCLVSPAEPVLAASTAIPAMRKLLTSYWNECATDQDLRQAARRPNDSLFASGACRIQVLRRRDVRHPLNFSTEELGRRLEVDWSPIHWADRNL